MAVSSPATPLSRPCHYGSTRSEALRPRLATGLPLCRGEVNRVAREEAKRLYPQTAFSGVVTRRSLADELKLNFDVEIRELARHIRAQGEHCVLDGREF